MPSLEKRLKQFNKERDAAILSYDVEKFKEFYNKYKAKGYYSIPLPPDEFLEITLRKMACEITSFTEEQREEARQWLRERGYEEGI